MQIHAAHGFLLSQFLSPLFNRRTDRWGGTLERRARILLDVVAAARSAVGPHYPVALKLNASDLLEGGLTEDQAETVLHRIDRGGEVTHHAPGQLVAYPVLDLRRREPDLHWYLRQLEQVVIDVLAALDLTGERIPGLTGVWLEGRKVAAIGVGCRRWITQHGLALNVSCDMEGFAQVVPCGLSDRPVDRLQRWIPGITPDVVQPLLRDALAQRLSLSWCDLAGLDSGWYS